MPTTKPGVLMVVGYLSQNGRKKMEMGSQQVGRRGGSLEKEEVKGREGGEKMTSSPEVGHQAKPRGKAAAQQNPTHCVQQKCLQ